MADESLSIVISGGLPDMSVELVVLFLVEFVVAEAVVVVFVGELGDVVAAVPAVPAAAAAVEVLVSAAEEEDAVGGVEGVVLPPLLVLLNEPDLALLLPLFEVLAEELE
jgi:hypothetical protein